MLNISYKDILRICLYGIGFSSIAALIYLAGPLVSIGGYRPLETYIGREIAVLVVGALFASVMSIQWRRRKVATAKIAEGIAADKVEDDSGVLKDKMKDALATLKGASGAKADFLYD
jgi:type VI secretion system protein ImpL